MKFGVFWFLLIFSICARGEVGDTVSFKITHKELQDLRDQVLAPEYRRTPQHETARSFQSKMISLSAWVEELRSSQVEVVCVGESHKKNYRTFFAESLLPLLKPRTLTLEMTGETVQALVPAALRGEAIDWLGAPLGDVIRMAQYAEASVQFIGLEPTQTQKQAELKESLAAPRDRQLSRDGFLAQNFMASHRVGELNVLLYGSNHCSKSDLALYDQTLMKRVKRQKQSKAQNALLVPRSENDHPLGAYLATLNLPKGTWVLHNWQDLDSEVFNDRFEVMKFQQSFDTVIYFQDQ